MPDLRGSRPLTHGVDDPARTGHRVPKHPEGASRTILALKDPNT
jgi:hypothetical protein